MPSDFQRSFDGPPLVAGSVFGVRGWGGGLVPGETPPTIYGSHGKPWRSKYLSAVHGVGYPPVVHEPPLTPPVEGCTCGIYAHWNLNDVSRLKGLPVGVVEGYGKVILGTNGFKAEKVRIVALSYEPLEWVNEPRLDGSNRRYPHPESKEDQVSDTRRFAEVNQIPFFDSINEMIEKHPLTKDYYDPSRVPDSRPLSPQLQAQLVDTSAKLGKSALDLAGALQALKQTFQTLYPPDDSKGQEDVS